MQAVELKNKTDKEGKLRIEHDLNLSDQNVRVIILIDEPESDAELNQENVLPEDIYLKASESSLEFWDNEIDDEIWNDV